MTSLWLVLAALALSACGGASDRVERSPGAPLEGEVRVFAASSLTASFTDLGRRLESSNPALEVTFNFAASSSLVRQVEQGGSADVLASADEPSMQRLVDADLVERPVVFARNKLAIVVGQGNPKKIRSLGDLAKPGVVVVLCGAQAPCGKSADQALATAEVRVTAASREENVKAVLTKVRLGEADAGIVYVTDVQAGGDKVDGVDIPDAHNVVASYPIARVSSASNAQGADAFVRLVTSPEGTETLGRYRFLRAT